MSHIERVENDREKSLAQLANVSLRVLPRYPELISRDDLKVFLPPIGGMTAYIWGDVSKIPDEDVELCCRVHDECNGSDVFGSDICTCRPYLTPAIRAGKG